MLSIISALVPVLALVALGYLINRTSISSADGWASLEKIAYFVLFPSLLVSNLATQDLKGIPIGDILIVVLVTSLMASAVLLVWYWFSRSVSGVTFTSVFQGGVRFNSYVALAVADAFFGEQGIAVAALAVSVMIVTVNLLAVSVQHRS